MIPPRIDCFAVLQPFSLTRPIIGRRISRERVGRGEAGRAWNELPKPESGRGDWEEGGGVRSEEEGGKNVWDYRACQLAGGVVGVMGKDREDAKRARGWIS